MQKYLIRKKTNKRIISDSRKTKIKKAKKTERDEWESATLDKIEKAFLKE